MRKTLLTSVSIVGLTLAGAAFAAGESTKGQTTQMPGTSAGQTGAQTQPQAAAPGMGVTHAGAQEFRSYEQMGDTQQVQVEGDFQADDLLDATVVNDEGEEIGEVVDLLVSDDDRAEKVMIRLSEDASQRIRGGATTGATTGATSGTDTTAGATTGGAAGMGGMGQQRHVAVDIQDLKRAEGGDGEIVLEKSIEEIGTMSFYEQQGDRWTSHQQ